MIFKVPDSPKEYTKVLTNFLGVDFTSIAPSTRRATNMVNLVNNNGYLETRQGYAAVGYDFGDNNVNGIWNVDKDGTDIFIVHVGTKLYSLDASFSNAVDISLADAMNDSISQGAYIDDKLLIFDGKRVIIYGKFGSTWEPRYLDANGYVPTTQIARTPDGAGTSYESINLVQPYRINSFLPDGATATYVLDSAYDDEKPTATILQSDGTIAELEVLSYDHTAGTVTFSSVPPVSPVDGRDSVFVRFKVTNAELVSYINKASIITTFGYNGNNNRIFATGNPDYPNVDWFSYADDATYFPADNYTRIGFQPIQNYLRLNDGTLAILKQVSDTDATIYYRKSALYNGAEVFPISSGVKSIGCISKYANGNLLNDPLTLTELGVYSIVGSDYGEKFASERGFFVKSKLLEETNLENAIAIVHNGKYYLAINSHVYVADSRYKSRVTESNSSDYQYEWYYWENVPVRTWFTYNYELYFTTTNGRIVKFNDTLYDYATPITQLFDTTFLDLGSITEAKTVKRVTVISRAYEDSEFTLSYITDDEVSAITTRQYETGDFPSTLQEKEKIKKVMFVKFRLSNTTAKKMNFYQIAVDYVLAGHFRG